MAFASRIPEKLLVFVQRGRHVGFVRMFRAVFGDGTIGGTRRHEIIHGWLNRVVYGKHVAQIIGCAHAFYRDGSDEFLGGTCTFACDGSIARYLFKSAIDYAYEIWSSILCALRHDTGTPFMVPDPVVRPPVLGQYHEGVQVRGHRGRRGELPRAPQR